MDKKVLYSPKEILLSATEFAYTGQAVEPVITIKDSQGKVISDSNYNVVYKNNINIGQANVEITFKNNYSGTSTDSFWIKEAVEGQVPTEAAIK